MTRSSHLGLSIQKDEINCAPANRCIGTEGLARLFSIQDLNSFALECRCTLCLWDFSNVGFSHRWLISLIREKGIGERACRHSSQLRDSDSKELQNEQSGFLFPLYIPCGGIVLTYWCMKYCNRSRAN
jgi:hypothetical protein